MVPTKKDLADGPHPNLHEVWPLLWRLGNIITQIMFGKVFFMVISPSSLISRNASKPASWWSGHACVEVLLAAYPGVNLYYASDFT
jgi:hypothetical protein